MPRILSVLFQLALKALSAIDTLWEEKTMKKQKMQGGKCERKAEEK
jgi:hypothetical protein